MRFRKWNHLRVIHLPHGVSNFGRVLLSGEPIEEIGEEQQRADKREKRDGEKHSERASRGTLTSMSAIGISHNGWTCLCSETAELLIRREPSFYSLPTIRIENESGIMGPRAGRPAGPGDASGAGGPNSAAMVKM